MTVENPPICPSCQRPDKVEKVSSIVEENYPITPAENTVPVEWAGKTYYVPARKETAKISPKRRFFRVDKGTISWNTSTSPLDWSLVKGPAPRLLPWIERPQNPPNINKMVLGICGWIAGGMALVWLGIVTKLRIVTIIGALFSHSQTNGLVVMLGTQAWFIRRNRKLAREYPKKLEKLPKAEVKWNELYYCYRCQGVFTKESDFIPLHKMQAFLYE